ncbi:hypothetical protein JCM10908_001756 [Rhodotorula pacifica]|uniref:uncharacterized protein n=1 Tax=Rhodotorula pacifica TaxID=1495444 RepID=UPI00316FB52E
MIRTPAYLNLPLGSVLVEDADEEIFLLYTRKLQLASSDRSEPQQAKNEEDQDAVKTDGLGFASEAGEVVPVSLTITDPWTVPSSVVGNATSTDTGGKKAAARRKKPSTSTNLAARRKGDLTVEVELHQSLDALRHRKGDTGSVLWRLSLHLAKYLLRSHHFPHASHPPLLPALASSTILELGSGTGFLGIALRDVVLNPNPQSETGGRWLFSDQLVNLPLVVRNLRANGEIDAQPTSPPLSASATLSKSPKLKSRTLGTPIAEQRAAASSASSSGKKDKKKRERVEVLELDWLAEAAEWDREQSRPSTDGEHGKENEEEGEEEGPLVILAVDCIYNPSLSAPLAKTILRQAQVRSAAHRRHGTLVTVASELRDEEPLQEFLQAWIDASGDEWTIARLGWEDEEERRVAGPLATGQFVVWVAWRKDCVNRD